MTRRMAWRLPLEAQVEEPSHQGAVLVDMHHLVADLDLGQASRLLEHDLVNARPAFRPACAVAARARLELGRFGGPGVADAIIAGWSALGRLTRVHRNPPARSGRDRRLALP